MLRRRPRHQQIGCRRSHDVRRSASTSRVYSHPVGDGEPLGVGDADDSAPAATEGSGIGGCGGRRVGKVRRRQ